MVAKIPDTHRDLVSDNKRALAYLATLMRDGGPHVTPVWFDARGEEVLVNTARGRVKDRNMTERPDVALVIQDPDNPYRYLMIRGRIVEITEQGAREHIDRLAQKYLGQSPYPWHQSGQVRVTYSIRPTAVSAQG